MLCASTKVVPLKYVVSSGLREHRFLVSRTTPIYPTASLPCHPVRVFRSNVWQRVLVPKATFQNEVEAISILGRIDGETVREGRYINVHSAYEAVVSPRSVHLSAIRHALAHATTSLTRNDVRMSLTQHFGGMEIDLHRHEHRKVYYRALVAMLVAIDDALSFTFLSRWNELQVAADA